MAKDETVKTHNRPGTPDRHWLLRQPGSSDRWKLPWIGWFIVFAVIFVITMNISYRVALKRVRARIRNVRQAEQLLLNGRFTEALLTYEKVVRWNPRVKMAWSGMGLCQLNIGRYEDAIDSYNHAIRLDPDLEYAWHGKAMTLEKLGRYEDAIRSYNRAIEISPGNVNIRNLRNRCREKLNRISP